MEVSDSNNWILFGRITPDRFPITIKSSIKGHSPAGAIKISYDFEIFIYNSQLIMSVKLIDGNTDIFTIRNCAVAQVRPIIDLIGAINGIYLDIDVISAAEKTSEKMITFGIDIQVLAQKTKKFSQESIDSNLLRLVGVSIPLQMALADLREAMRVPVGTGFFCFRAIEALMQSMKEQPDEKDANAWVKFRDVLNINRNTIDIVKKHADFPRHGRPSSISDDERASIFLITIDIIEKFIEFKLKNE